MLEYHCGSMQTRLNFSTEEEGASVNTCDASSKLTDIVCISTIVTDGKSHTIKVTNGKCHTIENNSESAAVQNCILDKRHMLLASSDNIVMKRKHAAIKNRARRLKLKMMIAKISLRRKVSERFRKIMLDYPYIGTVIENFVEEHSGRRALHVC